MRIKRSEKGTSTDPFISLRRRTIEVDFELNLITNADLKC